jgi:hypothetical protein
MYREWKKTEFPKKYYIWIWKQGWEVDQEIDGKMKWGRIKTSWCKRVEGKRNGRSSCEWQGIIAFCTCQWNKNEWMTHISNKSHVQTKVPQLWQILSNRLLKTRFNKHLRYIRPNTLQLDLISVQCVHFICISLIIYIVTGMLLTGNKICFTLLQLLIPVTFVIITFHKDSCI